MCADDNVHNTLVTYGNHRQHALIYEDYSDKDD